MMAGSQPAKLAIDERLPIACEALIAKVNRSPLPDTLQLLTCAASAAY
jgi:hypothetical protein